LSQPTHVGFCNLHWEALYNEFVCNVAVRPR